MIDIILFQEKKFTSSSKTTELPVLLDGGAHPVDLGVAGDGGVVDVDHDHLVVPGEETLFIRVPSNNKANVAFSLVGRILANPVGVEDAKPLEPPAHPLLSN